MFYQMLREEAIGKRQQYTQHNNMNMQSQRNKECYIPIGNQPARVINSSKELQLLDDSGLTSRFCVMTCRTIIWTIVIQIC